MVTIYVLVAIHPSCKITCESLYKDVVDKMDRFYSLNGEYKIVRQEKQIDPTKFSL